MAYKIYIEKQGKPYPYDKIKSNDIVEDDSKITTKIKPIDRKDANSEIEKGELVLDPKTGTLHKALGKPHSKGGTPVNLKENSFIFSNFKDLAINKKEKELFEFKMGGKKLKDNTPSKILEKEVDLEHHNKMVDILQNEKKYDASTTNAAKLMIMRNLEKAGQVAFLQETKKREAVPDFAQDTAPIYSKETDEQITQSMQYMQMGGNIYDKFKMKNVNFYNSDRLSDQLFQNSGRRMKLKNVNFYNTNPQNNQNSFYDPSNMEGVKNAMGNMYGNRGRFVEMLSGEYKGQKGFIEANGNFIHPSSFTSKNGATTPQEIQPSEVFPNNKFQDGGFKPFSNVKKTFYVYGPNGEILEEKDVNGKTIKVFKGYEPPTKASKTASLKSSDNKASFKNPSSLYDGTSGEIDPRIKTEYEAALVDAKRGVKNSQAYLKLQQKFHELYPEKATKILSEYDVTNFGRAKGIGKDKLESNVDSLWGPRTKRYLENVGVEDRPQKLKTNITTYKYPDRVKGPNENKIDLRPKALPQGEAPAEADGIIDRTTINTKLTPWQKIIAGIPFYRAATVRTQYPLRQHQESVIPQFDNKNVQPYLNTINQGYFNAAQTLRTLNPNQASSYISQLAGNRVDSSNQAISNIQNENVPTQNSQKGMAAASLNRDADANRVFDKDFYNSTQRATKNASDLREAYTQQGVQGINDMMKEKLKFDSWMNTQEQHKGRPTYKDKDGIQHYQGQPLYTPKPGFFGNSVQYNPTQVDWKTYQSTNNNKEENFRAQADAIREAFPSATDTQIMDMIKSNSKNKALLGYTSTLPQSFKRGGKYTPNFRPKNKLY